MADLLHVNTSNRVLLQMSKKYILRHFYTIFIFRHFKAFVILDISDNTLLDGFSCNKSAMISHLEDG